MNRGVWYAIGAYGLWGLFPIYWKALQHVPAPEILAHRMTWSLVFLAVLLRSRREFTRLLPALGSRRTVVLFTVAAVLLAINWLTYIWGVNAGFVVETSLGYFINPLVNVVLGVLFLRERLRRGQWAAVLLALAGVVHLTVNYGRLPWIALTLAFSFGTYGLLKKFAGLGALRGLFLETAILFLPAFAYLALLESRDQAAFAHSALPTTLLLAFTGVVTALPLLLFGAAARRIPLSTLGIVQYIAPTLQFLLGVLVYGEAFGGARVVGFVLVWAALAVYTVEGLTQRNRRRARERAAPPAPPS